MPENTWSAKPEPRDFPLLAALGIYTAALLALASPWLWGDAAIPYDAKSQFYPQLAFIARSLAEGQSPFWTPNIFAGWPQIADPQSLIFSPLHVVAALLNPNPSPWFADALVFVLLYAGGLGVILFFRDRGWHVGGALVAALAFSFGGSAASRIQHVGQVESLVFLPLTLWMLARALERSSWRAGMAAGVFAAAIVLGRDQVALIAVYVLAGYVLWHLFSGDDWSARLWASVKPLAAGTVAGALIVAVPLAMTALLAMSSNRPEIGYPFAAGGSLHPANLLMLVFSGLFGASDFGREFWGPPGFPWHERFGPTDLFIAQNVGQIYAGALAIVAVLGLGLARGGLWARDIRYFTIAAVVTLLYALGKYTPAFHLIYATLPGVSFYRRPADATFVFCALVAIVAGYLVHCWLTDTVTALPRKAYAGGVVIAGALIAVAVGLALSVGRLPITVLPILWGIGFSGTAIITLVVARRLAKRGMLPAAVLLAAFSIADLGWNHAPNESTGLPRALYADLHRDTKDETVALLRKLLESTAGPDRRDRVELLGIAYHWPNIGLIHDFDHLFGHNPLRLAEFARVTAAPDTVAGVDQRRFTPLLPSYNSPIENLFGVRFIAAGAPIGEVDSSIRAGDLKFITRTKSAYIYENPKALPRVMLATDWRVADFDEMIRHGGWPDVDLRRTVLLERAPATPRSDASIGAAQLSQYRNTQIEIEVDAPAGGILVLNDVWHPWWRASVNGKAAEILKANVIFRAVEIPPGRHVVRFEFRPFSGALDELRKKLIAVSR